MVVVLLDWLCNTNRDRDVITVDDVRNYIKHNPSCISQRFQERGIISCVCLTKRILNRMPSLGNQERMFQRTI